MRDVSLKLNYLLLIAERLYSLPASWTMGTMAKKAKKVRSEVIVTPEQASAVELPDSEEEVKPKKKNKKKNKEVVESSDTAETTAGAAGAAGLDSPDTKVIKSKKKNKKKNKDTTDSSETAEPESSGSNGATEETTARPKDGNLNPKSSKERMKVGGWRLEELNDKTLY